MTDSSPPSKSELHHLRALRYQGVAPASSGEASLLATILTGPRPQDAEPAMLMERQARDEDLRFRNGRQDSAMMERMRALKATGIHGFRLKAIASSTAPADMIYDRAFLPIDTAIAWPQLIRIPGVETGNLPRTPPAGKVVLGPGEITELPRLEAPAERQAITRSGCLAVVVACLVAGAWLTVLA